ncbi:MAG: retropepsin-like domain-containing protein [Nitrospira sp.]|nr:retropepsin-like domain-containing protein [Nitrospira sp.]
MFVTLRLEGGEELLFNVDTGAPVTVLDKSLEPRLGQRLGKKPIHYAWKSGTAHTYRAPKLYLGNAPLRTGDVIWTDDLSQHYHSRDGRPVLGILGMDCMRSYAVQLDFAARKIRLFPSGHGRKNDVGKAFPLRTTRAGHWVVRESFAGTKAVNLIVDTGCALDGVLEPKRFRLALQQQGIAWTNQFKYPTGLVRDTARFHEVVFGGERYASFFIDKSPAITYKRRSYYLNSIGLPFFARHSVTFDFPNRTMYLKRRDIADRHKPVGMNGGLPIQSVE